MANPSLSSFKICNDWSRTLPKKDRSMARVSYTYTTVRSEHLTHRKVH
jgi:hypothetical protein